jgi:flagellar biosynthesis component FlhA
MLTDTVKYWLAVAAIMLVMWGYSGRISTMLIFGIAAVGAFIYWRITAQRKKRALEAARPGEPGGV